MGLGIGLAGYAALVGLTWMVRTPSSSLRILGLGVGRGMVLTSPDIVGHAGQ